MGGRDNTWNFSDEVWRSTDGGATWTLMTSAPGWSPRGLARSVVLPDGSILLMGGAAGSAFSEYFNDVWRSTDFGATWTEITGHAPWTARIPFGAVTLPDGSVVIIGGTAQGSSGSTWVNDTWRLPTAGSNEQNPTHQYTGTGTFQVVLSAYNTYGAALASSQISVIPPIPGDVDASGTIDLADVIRSLQVLAGETGFNVSTGGDVDGDEKIGLPEAIYDLIEVSQP
jgi:hypothetical protein